MTAPAAAPPSPDDILRATGALTLGDEPPAEALAHVLREFARLSKGSDPATLAALRAGMVRLLKRHGVRASDVDAVIGGGASLPVEGVRQGQAVVLEDPEPWPDPVEGAELLAEIIGVHARYLAMPEGGPTASALYALHTHAHDAAECSPILAYTSPQPRCGKTNALTIMGALAPRSLSLASISAAALYRLIERDHPTILIDEAEDLGSDELAAELRRLLRAGHTRSTAWVSRCEGDDHEPRVYSVWAPRVVALIGGLQGALGDRAIVVPMRRRRPDEHVHRLRVGRIRLELEPQRRRAARWAADHLDELRDADPDIPSGLHDRAADCWRPLLAIADAVGGGWPDRARRAALVLSGSAEPMEDDVGTLLLSDVRHVMAGCDRVASADLVRALADLGPGRPWSEWKRGEAITERGIARLLRPYGVRSRKLRIGERAGIHGYRRDDLVDAWSRYLANGASPLEPPHQPHTNSRAEDRGALVGHKPDSVDLGQSVESAAAAPGVADVAVAGPPGQESDQYEAAERVAIQAEAQQRAP